jgi:hypothetical protein
MLDAIIISIAGFPPCRSDFWLFGSPNASTRIHNTQDVPYVMRFLLHVCVSLLRDRPITPLKGDVVISCAWYTSGNPLNCGKKSDQAGMVIR